MLTITIQRDGDEAVYAQIARQVRQLAASGALAPGSPLPSVRQLARDLEVNLNTVARAYRLLEAEGFLTIQNRAGVCVAAPAPAIDDSARDALVEELQVILARLRQAGMAREELRRLLHDEVASLDGEAKGAGP
jgi:GntR family transcriptional regulator